MDWLERTAKLRQWTRSGTRAPHKPLLFLYALGRFQQDAHAELRHSAVEEDLKQLLAEYGPSNKTTPAYPFHHPASDAVWEVRTDHGRGSPGSGVRELRASGAAGQLAPDNGLCLCSLHHRLFERASSASVTATASWSRSASSGAAPPPASTS